MKHRVLFVMLLCVFVTGAARAQDAPPAPVLLLINGANIWGYYPTGLTQLTPTRYGDRPALSPDGGRFAYKTVADIGVRALQTTGGLVSELPSDIRLYDLNTRLETVITGQPPDATFNTGEPARAIVRSAPAWSPDGAAIAWTEDVAPEAVRRLVIYTPATGETRILTEDLPLQAGFQQTLALRWGPGGIALHSVTAAPAGAGTPQPMLDAMLVYSPDGALLSSTSLRPAEGEYLYAFEWIDDGGADKVGVIYSTGRWELIDPATGMTAPLSGTPELYSTLAPDGLALRFGVAHHPDRGAVFTWRAGDVVLPYSGPLEWVSIAPAGDAVAYADGGIGYIWRDGETQPIFGTNDYNARGSDVVWGPTAWRVAAP